MRSLMDRRQHLTLFVWCFNRLLMLANGPGFSFFSDILSHDTTRSHIDFELVCCVGN